MDLNRITIIELTYKNKKNKYYKLLDKKMKLDDYIDYFVELKKCKKVKIYKCYEVIDL